MSGSSRERIANWTTIAAWLLFLIFPLIGVLEADTSVGWRALGVAVIFAFAAVDLHSYWWAGAITHRLEQTRTPWLHLALLVGLTAIGFWLLGYDALTFVPFIVMLAIITAPPFAAVAFAAAALATAVAVPLLGGQPQQLAFLIVLCIIAAAGLSLRVLDRAESMRVERERAADLAADRERMARDLHDVLGHSLTAVTIKAELAERLLASDPDAAARELQAVQSLTRQSLAEIRATVAGLRVARLDQELDNAGQALADADIEATFDGDPETVDPRHRIVLAWALREAVTNVVRHSGARNCNVRLEGDLLFVADDGVGVEGRAEGNGLRGLRERVGAGGGAVDLSERAGGGTELTVRMQAAS